MCASNQNGTAKNATWITLRVYATFHPLFSTNHPMAYKRNVRKTAFASKLRNSNAASSSAEQCLRPQTLRAYEDARRDRVRAVASAVRAAADTFYDPEAKELPVAGPRSVAKACAEHPIDLPSLDALSSAEA